MTNVLQCDTIAAGGIVIIAELQWDDENVNHIARHRTDPQEVEDVCFGIHVIRSEGEGRYILSGKTTTGRYLHAVIENIGKGLFRPITAFDMSEKHKRKYRRRLK